MRMLKRVGSVSLVALLILSMLPIGAMVFAEGRAITVVDGVTAKTYTTDAETVDGFFAEQGIKVAEDDLVIPAAKSSLENVSEINIYRAVDISILVDGVTYNMHTAAPSVKDAVEQITEVSVNDTILPSGKSQLENGMVIEVHRAKNINFNLYGQSAVIVTSEETVDGFLAARGIILGANDQISPAGDTPITEGMTLTIKRVEVSTRVQTVEIPFTKETRDNSSLESGKTKLAQAGVNGTKEQTVEVTYENGVEVSSKVVSEKVTKAAVPEITEVGTKNTVRVAGSNLSYSKVLTCTATAYDAGAGSNGKWAGKTASGIPLERGVVAVDPRVIPLGTRLYIEAVDGSWAYGYAVAGDTGGAIKGNKVDLFMETYNECMQFGRRQCKVYVLN